MKLISPPVYSDAALRIRRAAMDESFDRAPGAGRSRNFVADPGLAGNVGDSGDPKATLFNQREPLRQPRTLPPFAENNLGAADVMVAGGRELSAS